MRYNKILYGITISILLLLGTAACGGGEQPEENNGNGGQGATEAIQFKELDRSQLGEDQIIAVYEGGQVTGEEFAQYLAFWGFMNPNLDINSTEERQKIVKDYIFEQLYKEKAQVTDEVQAQADGLWEQLEMIYDEQTRQQGYEKLGTSEQEVKEMLLDSLAIQTAALEDFQGKVTENEVTSRYNESEVQEQITTADVRHILIQTHTRNEAGELEEVRPEAEAKEIADDLYKQLQEGADFAELAKEHSEDEGSQENGGLYSSMPVITWVPEFKEAALTQEINEIGQPVQTMFGFHIIRVEDRTVMPLEEVREAIVNELAGQKAAVYYDQTLPELIKEINI